MVIDGTDPFAASKPDARLIKLLLKARRFNATLVGSDEVPFAALAEREGVSPSYFTRLVRLCYLAPDITHAILRRCRRRGRSRSSPADRQNHFVARINSRAQPPPRHFT